MFSLALLCLSYLGPVCLICVFGVFSLICFELSVPVQVIAWKDSSLKLPIMCRAGDKKNSTYSLTLLLILKSLAANFHFLVTFILEEIVVSRHN